MTTTLTTFFTYKRKSYVFDSWACYRNGSPYFIGLPDGRTLKVAWWDHDNNPLKEYDTPPQPTRIFNMDMPIPEDAKVFPATEVTY